MVDVLNPAQLMREGREQMRRDAEAAAQPAAAHAQQPAAVEKFRDWMSPPSSLRSHVNWQKDSGGWQKPWQRYIDWATTNSPSMLTGIEEGEVRLTAARKEAGSNSDIRVLNAQSALTRSYYFLEQAYENSFKKPPRY